MPAKLYRFLKIPSTTKRTNLVVEVVDPLYLYPANHLEYTCTYLISQSSVDNKRLPFISLYFDIKQVEVGTTVL